MSRIKKFTQFLNENNSNDEKKDRIDYPELKQFLTELGFKDMYMMHRNDPKQLELVFSKLLKGKNLKKFKTLMNPPYTDEEKDEMEIKKEKEKREKNIERYKEVEDELRSLYKESANKLVDKYIKVFNLDKNIKKDVLDYIFGMGKFSESVNEDDVIPREHEIIEDIAMVVTDHKKDGSPAALYDINTLGTFVQEKNIL